MHQLSLFDYNALDAETRIVVQQRTSEIKTLMRRTAQDIIDMGQKFAEVRDVLRHNKSGGFEAWCAAEGFGRRTAYRCIGVYETFGNRDTVTQLDLSPKVLYLLSSETTPEEARQEVIERAESGESINPTTAQQIVTTHKSAPAYDEDEETEYRYDGGLATCKYCYATHDHWVLSSDHDSDWICRECRGVTSDEFMELVESEFYVRDEDFPHRARLQDDEPYPAHQIVWERPALTRAEQSLRVLQSSESNEWYTPAQYIEAARQVMGSITLDPASNLIANKTVKAESIFTIDDNGLKQSWYGNVWLNPPYGFSEDNRESNQAVWTARLVEEYKAGNVEQAVLLVNAVTDRQWFKPLWDYPLCFTDHRIKFYSPDADGGSPTMGSVLVYFGANRDAFIESFRCFGAVVTQVVR